MSHLANRFPHLMGKVKSTGTFKKAKVAYEYLSATRAAEWIKRHSPLLNTRLEATARLIEKDILRSLDNSRCHIQYEQLYIFRPHWDGYDWEAGTRTDLSHRGFTEREGKIGKMVDGKFKTAKLAGGVITIMEGTGYNEKPAIQVLRYTRLESRSLVKPTEIYYLAQRWKDDEEFRSLVETIGNLFYLPKIEPGIPATFQKVSYSDVLIAAYDRTEKASGLHELETSKLWGMVVARDREYTDHTKNPHRERYKSSSLNDPSDLRAMAIEFGVRRDFESRLSAAGLTREQFNRLYKISDPYKQPIEASGIYVEHNDSDIVRAVLADSFYEHNIHNTRSGAWVGADRDKEWIISNLHRIAIKYGVISV